MAVLTPQQVVLTGLVPTYAAAAGGGDSVGPAPNQFLVVKAGGTGATVTVDSVTPSNYGTDADLVVVVSTSTERWIGPLNPDRFTNATTGVIGWTYSQVATVTVAVVRL